MSSAVNVLRNCLKIVHITKADLSDSIAFTVLNKYGKGAVVQIPTVAGPIYHVACERVL